MSTLFLIRHAQASFGKVSYDKLSETGKKQSTILARYLHGINMNFDEIYSGTMVRHRETVDEYIAVSKDKDISIPEIKYDSRLNELDAEGLIKILLPVLLKEKPEMKHHIDKILTDQKSLQIIFTEIMMMWISGNFDIKGASTWDEFRSGIFSFLDERMRENTGNKKIAAFTSGGPISFILMKILSLDINTSMQIINQIINTSITRIKYTSDEMMLSSFNEYPHLEQESSNNIITYR